MALFFMFGKYSPQAVKEISKEPTQKVLEIARRFGGEIKQMHVLLGAYDLVLIAEFPVMKEALQASVAVTKATDISFSTLPAVSVEEFDQLVSKR